MHSKQYKRCVPNGLLWVQIPHVFKGFLPLLAPRIKFVVTASNREGVWARTGEPSVFSCERESKRADNLLYAKNIWAGRPHGRPARFRQPSPDAHVGVQN